MKVVSQSEQITRMESIACATGAPHYEDIREYLFEQLNEEYGRQKWTFVPLSRKQEQTFTDWLASDDE